jgi:hypothetical protein
MAASGHDIVPGAAFQCWSWLDCPRQGLGSEDAVFCECRCKRLVAAADWIGAILFEPTPYTCGLTCGQATVV